MEKNQKTKTTGLTTLVLFFSGICLVLISVIGSHYKWHELICEFIRDLGLLLSAVMAGTLLHEKLLRDEMLNDITSNLELKLREHVPEKNENAELIAATTHKLFSETPPQLKGIKLISDVRRNFVGYYKWVIEQRPQELFFAGRSVLHRIDADISLRTQGYAEDIILRKLMEGSRIRILFIDPRIDIIERLADEEGQNPETLLSDIARSLGICIRIFNLLNSNFQNLSASAELSIRIYNKIPNFAYHKQDNDVIIGFYFSSMLGSTSAAYELLDDLTKNHFGDHFVEILSKGTPIVEFDGARRSRPTFNKTLFDQLISFLEKKLDPKTVTELVYKSDQTNSNNKPTSER